MNTKISKAPSASISNNNIAIFPLSRIRLWLICLIVGVLAACATKPPSGTYISNEYHPKSVWTPVSFADLPGWPDDSFQQAWTAWNRSCIKPAVAWVAICAEMKKLNNSSEIDKQIWLQNNFQVFAVSNTNGNPDGLLTSYYEPEFNASRTAKNGFNTPLYKAPDNLQKQKPWYSRKDIDTLPEAKAQLSGREIVYLADPIDALILHIQGSGKVKVIEADGRQRWIRIAFAGTNEQPYKSVGKWLIDQGAVKDASWRSIKEWAIRNPNKVQEMLWANPRYVFFKEENISETDPSLGPKGAQGVPLTARRSIAIDPGSMPYGTPVWLSTKGPTLNESRLMIAQDTGSAITGAVRADYFMGSGFQAGELASQVKQNLRVWVLQPKTSSNTSN